MAPIKKIKSTEVKIIAAFFLVAGFVGFISSFVRLIPLINVLDIVLGLFAELLFGLTAYSGFLLLKENEKGLEIGRAVVAMQIVNFNIAGLAYSFVTGAYLFAGIAHGEVGFAFGLETVFAINLTDEMNFVFRLNVLAIVVFVYLTRTLNRIYDEEDLGVLDADRSIRY